MPTSLMSFARHTVLKCSPLSYKDIKWLPQLGFSEDNRKPIRRFLRCIRRSHMPVSTVSLTVLSKARPFGY